MNLIRRVGFFGIVLVLGCSSSSDENAEGAPGASGARGDEGTGGALASGGEPSTSGGEPSTSGGSEVNGGSSSGGGVDSSGGGATGGTGGLDTPYANVVAVAVDGSPDEYTFNVSVESADIDCTQYANWWEVLAEDGTLLYRRILDHSHTDENGTSDEGAPGNTFTRSGGPVPVGDTDVVLVRAHMSVGGYNGVVMRGTVADGFVPATDLPADFAANVESSEPQPTGCLF